MGWGILIISIFGVFCAFVILQATFAQRSWRKLVNQGDEWAIRSLLEEEIDRWRRMRVPKGQSPTLWRGLGTTQVVSVGADFVHVAARAEGDYQIVDGRQREVSSPFDEGVKLAAALIERCFYDIPNVRPRIVRVDIYTTFRNEDGVPEQKCILTTTGTRAVATGLPWEDLRPIEILSRFNTRYRIGKNGEAVPIDPGPPLSDEDDLDALASAAATDTEARAAIDAAEQLIAGRRNESDDPPSAIGPSAGA